LGGGVDAAQLLGQGEGAFGLGAVGQESAGLPAQRVGDGARPYPAPLGSERVLSEADLEQYARRADAAAVASLRLKGYLRHGGAWAG
jgi:hypothetical protein